LEDGESIPSYFMVPHRCSASSQRVLRGLSSYPSDSNSNLVIEINIAWALSSSVGEGRGLLPVLSGTASVEREPPERMEERIGSRARLVGLPDKMPLVLLFGERLIRLDATAARFPGR